MRGETGEHLRWPSHRFFWSVLDAPGVRVTGELPTALLDEVSGDIPVSVEDVHVVVTPTDAGKVVACAVRRAELDVLGPSARSLVPDQIPGSIGVDADPQRLNLLVGMYEPQSSRRENTRRHMRRAAVLMVLAGLVTIGFVRRARYWNSVERDSRTASEALAREILPEQSTAVIDLALDAELARLRRATQVNGMVAPPADATVHLANLLNAWPSGIASKPQSIAIAGSGISISASVEGDASPFLKAFKPPRGWTIDEPRINSSGNITRLSLQLRPSAPIASSGLSLGSTTPLTPGIPSP